MSGDTVSEEETAFNSAPATGRGGIATLLTFATYFPWNLATMDATQASLQSDDLSKKDRSVIIAPTFIRLPHPSTLPKCDRSGMAIVSEPNVEIAHWDVKKGLSTNELNRGRGLGLITHKPLYGGRDAPPRWYLEICSALRTGGWDRFRSDMCTFVKYVYDAEGNATKPPSGIIAHVGDLLSVSCGNDRILFQKAMSQFRTGELECLSGNCPHRVSRNRNMCK